jgi:hypothetical protein
MFIELHMSSCSAIDWEAKKILPQPSHYFAVHRITFQWKITHLYKVHYRASLQALKLSSDRMAKISHLRVGRIAVTDCKNSRVPRLGVFQWRMCEWSVVKISKQVQKFLVNKTNRCTEFQCYWYHYSTCFGQAFCPSSAVLSCISALVHFMLK